MASQFRLAKDNGQHYDGVLFDPSELASFEDAPAVTPMSPLAVLAATIPIEGIEARTMPVSQPQVLQTLPVHGVYGATLPYAQQDFDTLSIAKRVHETFRAMNNIKNSVHSELASSAKHPTHVLLKESRPTQMVYGMLKKGAELSLPGQGPTLLELEHSPLTRFPTLVGDTDRQWYNVSDMRLRCHLDDILGLQKDAAAVRTDYAHVELLHFPVRLPEGTPLHRNYGDTLGEVVVAVTNPQYASNIRAAFSSIVEHVMNAYKDCFK